MWRCRLEGAVSDLVLADVEAMIAVSAVAPVEVPTSEAEGHYFILLQYSVKHNFVLTFHSRVIISRHSLWLIKVFFFIFVNF